VFGLPLVLPLGAVLVFVLKEVVLVKELAPFGWLFPGMLFGWVFGLPLVLPLGAVLVFVLKEVVLVKELAPFGWLLAGKLFG